MNASIEKLADFQIRLYNLRNPFKETWLNRQEQMIDDSKSISNSEHNQGKNKKNHEPIKKGGRQ
jgi:hypothetical protein